MNKNHRRKYKIWWTVVLVIVLALVVFFRGAFGPRQENEQKAVAVAEKYAHLSHKSNYYEFSRAGKEYHTVEGTNRTGEKIYAIVSANNRRINVFAANKGLTAKQFSAQIVQQRKPKRILHVALGMDQQGKQPVWEVTYLNQSGNLCYSLVEFKTGTVTKEIQNL